ncbi:MAG: lipoxygenase [Myxococcales bacterium]|nr:lipoxygenase [Myxococcales bacterium]
MHLTLPQHDHTPQARARAREAERARYRYDYSDRGLCFLRELHRRDRFSVRYLAKGAEAALALRANRRVSELLEEAGSIAARGRAALSILRRADATPRLGAAWRTLRGDSREPAPTRPRALDDYLDIFTTIARPAICERWHEDWCFAWQRVAGQCPVILQRLTQLPPQMPVTESHFRRARPRDPGSLADALARGRLFVADYARFDGATPGRTDGRQKYVYAPIALYLALPGDPVGLAPVAIQCAQRPGPANPVLTPADGEAWRLAKLVVQTADENLEGVLVHLGWCHMVAQRFIIAALRNLAPRHPLRRLLEPHFEHTLAVNDYARDNVCNPGGSQDRLLAPAIDSQIELLQRSLGELRYDDLDPELELARRGVDDPEFLPVYPFRDDGLLSWRALQDFVRGYVRRYYTRDEDAARDHELRAMIDEIAALDGGRLPRLVEGVDTGSVSGVAELLARILYRLTVYHAAINYSSVDWVSWVPNLPTAGYAPIPDLREPVREADWLAMLPPVDIGYEALDTVYTVAVLRFNRLGRYPPGHFTDPQVLEHVRSFQARLEAIERTIVARNTGDPRGEGRPRPLPYPYLLPSRITASINS